jgi:hypothetical protein
MRVLDQFGPNSVGRRRCRPCHDGRWGVALHQQEPGVALNLDWLHQTEGDPGAGPSSQATLTLGLGFLRGHHLPPLTHQRIGRWNPQTRPPLREVARSPLAPSAIGALALTHLH